MRWLWPLVNFLQALFRSLRLDSKIPWPEYYTQAREFARRYAERGVPLESLMEGLNVFRRTVVARVTEGVPDPLRQPRVGLPDRSIVPADPVVERHQDCGA